MATEGLNPDGSLRTRLDQLGRQAGLVEGSGPTTPSSSAGTGSTDESPRRPSGKLNPYFSAWLMSIPPEWVDAGLRAMAGLSRKKRSKDVPPS